MMLNVPLVGEIERRLLVNYRCDPEVVQRLLPEPFRPALVQGQAVVGLCLMRLTRLRPAGLPAALGVTTEHGAHRMAVEWDDDGDRRSGVFVPRRDTASPLAALVGGRLFPGDQHRATFIVDDVTDRVRVAYRARDGSIAADVDAVVADELPPSELFSGTTEVSDFFERGSMGFSSTRGGACFDGVEVATKDWHVEPVSIRAAQSTYFDDTERFPDGSIHLDSAVLMRNVAVRWTPIEPLGARPHRRGSLRAQPSLRP